jgi:uncharacterized protein (TIGR03437 family)
VAAIYLLLAGLLFRSCLWAQDGKAPPPSFSPDSIVNSANGSSASLTPNVLATIYGTYLSDMIGKVSLGEVGSGQLPTDLAGVRITVAGVIASLLFVSPTQINFVIPANLLPGTVEVSLERDAVAAPKVRINLLDAAPALFVKDNGSLAATHADGSLITADAPGQPGEWIVVYGTGLGRTVPRQTNGLIPRSVAPIALIDRLRVLLDGQALPLEGIYYAGITPGYPGLYQINLRLPETILNPGPELRVAMDDQMSQSALVVQVDPTLP